MTSADWANKDFYKVLGVAKDASAADIKKAYRRLARDNHPDSHPGDQAAEDRFKTVAEAYDVVGDPEKRKEYDDLRSGLGGFGPFTTAGSGGAGQQFDLNDLFGGGTGTRTTAGGGGFSDLFGGMFGGGGGRTRTTSAPRRGADVETTATIGFADSIEGVTVALRLTSDAPCPDCSGTGAKAGTLPRVCPDCEGVGMRAASVGGAFTMNETCPTCRGRGLVVDGPAGDLYVDVKVSDHPLFGRRGDNLTLAVPVSFDEAALGADIKVPTLGGAPVTLKIPAGTPNGRSFRVRGRGVRRSGGASAGSTGDLLVTVEVQVPAVLDEQARAAVQAYRDATGAADLRANLFDARSRPGTP